MFQKELNFFYFILFSFYVVNIWKSLYNGITIGLRKCQLYYFCNEFIYVNRESEEPGKFLYTYVSMMSTVNSFIGRNKKDTVSKIFGRAAFTTVDRVIMNCRWLDMLIAPPG